MDDNLTPQQRYNRTEKGRAAAKKARDNYAARHPDRELARRSSPEAKAKRAEASRRHYEANREEVLAKQRTYQLMDRFHLTPEEYDAMLERQGGVCAICSSPPPTGGRNRNLAVDHDRNCCPGPKSCGECVRGLLCSNCNVAIGLLGDDVARLQRTIDYLSMKG